MKSTECLSHHFLSSLSRILKINPSEIQILSTDLKKKIVNFRFTSLKDI